MALALVLKLALAASCLFPESSPKALPKQCALKSAPCDVVWDSAYCRWVATQSRYITADGRPTDNYFDAAWSEMRRCYWGEHGTTGWACGKWESIKVVRYEPSAIACFKCCEHEDELSLCRANLCATSPGPTDKDGKPLPAKKVQP